MIQEQYMPREAEVPSSFTTPVFPAFPGLPVPVQLWHKIAPRSRGEPCSIRMQMSHCGGGTTPRATKHRQVVRAVSLLSVCLSLRGSSVGTDGE